MSGWLLSGNKLFFVINVQRLRRIKRRFHRTSMFHNLDYSSLNNLLQLCQHVRYMAANRIVDVGEACWFIKFI